MASGHRLWRILEMPVCYFSGLRFLQAVRDVKPDLPPYGDVMEARRRDNLSTSRRDYFRDIFMDLDEANRVRVVVTILARFTLATKLSPPRSELLAGGVASRRNVPAELWNAERLSRLLGEIDERSPLVSTKEQSP
jgi:hypothetical protein